MTLENYIFTKDSKQCFVLNMIDTINRRYLILVTPISINEINEIKTFRSVSNKNDFQDKSELVVMNEDDILSYTYFGKTEEATTSENYLNLGEKVRFNFIKYTIVGFVLNKYAQLNIPMPVLFNKEKVVRYYKKLIFSKFSDEKILDKVNISFNNGDFSEDIEIPFVDSTEKESWGSKIKILERYSVKPYEVIKEKIETEGSYLESSLLSSKSYLKSFILAKQEDSLEKLADTKPEFYKHLFNLIESLNNKIYKIESEPSKIVEKESESEQTEETEEIDFDELMSEEIDFDSLLDENIF